MRLKDGYKVCHCVNPYTGKPMRNGPKAMTIDDLNCEFPADGMLLWQHIYMGPTSLAFPWFVHWHELSGNKKISILIVFMLYLPTDLPKEYVTLP